MRRRFLWLLAIVGVAALAGRLHHRVTWEAEARRSPEPGHLFDAGGLRLQLHCTGKPGQPVVVLESGLGDTLEQWRFVQPEIARFARVCSYDRAGHGNSDEGEYPQTSQHNAERLHALLQRAGERPPYVLVASSAGGYHARVFHGRYPSEVTALVLVDCTHEDQYHLLPLSWRAVSEAMLNRYRSQARWAPLDVEFGILRFRLWWQGTPAPYLLLQAKYFRARASELENMRVNAEQARSAGDLRDKPLIVLTGARNADAEFARVVDQVQPRLAKLSTRGKRIVLQDSGHDIAADRPDAVVAAVREVRPVN